MIQDDWRDGKCRRQYSHEAGLESAEHVSIVAHLSVTVGDGAPRRSLQSVSNSAAVASVMMEAALRKMDDHEQDDGHQ